MKKMRSKFATLALALALVGTFILGAGASAAYTAVTAYLNYGITIEYKGEEQQLFDANGVRLYPITYNDSTYVPIRAISQILGENVDWDQATKTVILGTPIDGLDLIDNIKPYSVTDTRYFKTTTSSDGKDSSIAGIPLTHWADIYGKNSGYYNLGGKYSILTFQAYSDANMTLEVRGDNDMVLASIDIVAKQLPKTYTVPLADASQLCFGVTSSNWDHLYIFNTVLK